MENLKDLMPMYENNYVKIGTNHGAGFMFCGKLKDFVSKAENYDRYTIAKKEKALKNLESRLKTFSTSESKIIFNDMCRSYERVKEHAERNIDVKDIYAEWTTLKDFKKHLKEEVIPKKKAALEKRVKKAQDNLDNYVGLFEREVVDIYMSILVNNHGEHDYIILIDGDESDCWWTLEEYERGWIMNDDGKQMYRDKMEAKED